MPGPGNKNKAKAKPKVKTNTVKNSLSQTSLQSQPTVAKVVVPCMTLDEDEITRCGNPATEGYPKRCKTHHGQYVTMYLKYKEASKVVDEIAKGGKVPTKEKIKQYTDVSVALNRAREVRRYIEAIRVERTGRDIHGRRFFLKVDDGHKFRIKLLAKEMIRAVEALDGLQTQAYKLHCEKNPRPDWAHGAVSPSANENDPIKSRPTTEQIVAVSSQSSAKAIEGNPSRPHQVANEQADLIDLEMRAQKAQMLYALEFILDANSLLDSMENTMGVDPKSQEAIRTSIVLNRTLRQYALRIIFYEPTLFVKSLGKVSLKDFVLSDEFSMEDLARFTMLFTRTLDFGLLWIKDSMIEGLTISAAGLSANAANVGDPKNRIKILDGWIYNVTHVKKISNEAWFRLSAFLRPIPPNVENRFVRLCNTYDDLISFLSFGAMGNFPSPSFCQDVVTYRNHLSLCGVVMADMVSSSKPAEMCLFPSTLPSRRSGYRMWGCMEARAYMFGAVRNEPDSFTESFLEELKARPDIFHVVTRSETDPGRKVEIYGPPAGVQPLPHMRCANFEAPVADRRPEVAPTEWTVIRSAEGIFYGTNPDILGYLTELERGGSAGWFFHFKKFKVKYIAIIDVVPNRHHEFLAQQVAWAALRAHGYAKGDYDEKKYAAASHVLFDKCAQERLGWLPAGSWSTTKMSV